MTLTVQAAWTIACLYTLAYLLLLGYTCWLHKRVLRLEHPEYDFRGGVRGKYAGRVESSKPCLGALCKAGRLPNGDPCRLCQPPHPLGPLCPDCSARGTHSAWCDRV